jgi:hypothetical protein
MDEMFKFATKQKYIHDQIFIRLFFSMTGSSCLNRELEQRVYTDFP